MRYLLTFILGWAATLVPLWPHQVATFWMWGALSGSAVASTVWVASRLAPRQAPVRLLTGCVLLISLAALFDFWRLPPAFMLSLCRASPGIGLAADIARHLDTHWTWFLGTNITMLAWIWVMPHPPLRGLMGRRILQGFALSVLMVASMALTMPMVEFLAAWMHMPISADAFVSAMVCGMALYHMLHQLLLAAGNFIQLNRNKERDENRHTDVGESRRRTAIAGAG